MTAGLVDDVDLEKLADELLEQADELEPQDDDEPEDDDDLDGPPPALLRHRPRPHPPRRTVADGETRAALLELVGLALGARIAHDVEDDDLALKRLEQTAHRAAELTELLRARLDTLALSDPVPTVA